MANIDVISRTPDEDGEYEYKQNVPEELHPISDWVHNPDLSLVDGISPEFWIWDGTNVVAASVEDIFGFTPDSTNPSNSTPALAPVFVIWAEENGGVSVGATNYEFSYGNGATNTTSDPSGIPLGVRARLISIGVSGNTTSTSAASVAISVTNNGIVVATSDVATASGTTGAKIQVTTDVSDDDVIFEINDTLQFKTATATGSITDVRVFAWLERIQ